MEHYPQLVPLIILIPAIGAIINYFWGVRLGERASGIIATTASTLAFVVAVLLFAYLSGSNYQSAIIDPPLLHDWIRIGAAGVNIPWQMRVDTLSVTMMLVVTGVGSLIHLYSIGYIHGDSRIPRFFGYLNMFLAFMLVLVTANNLLMMFVGWEGVGLCSFLLIGFWFDRPNGVGWKNSNAGRKAMILNRIGDFGVLMAIFLTFWTFHTVDFYKPGEIAVVHDTTTQTTTAGGETTTEGGSLGAEGFTDNTHIATDQLGIFGQAQRMIDANATVQIGPFNWPITTVLTIITLFLLLGATGKSAQIPLFVWLPDAMAGPTPVSALMHAATMVTAGVYMMVRCNVLFAASPLTSLIVALIGTATALVAGYIALGQWDIKRVLAYSTVSQLGFMVTAVGVGAYDIAIFHLVTHAFFKALLFRGSGSVIHGMEHGHHDAEHAHAHVAEGEGEGAAGHHDESAGEQEHEFDPQDMRNMGGLRHKMPITYWTYVIGTLALAGIFPFAGFWSKDDILAHSWLAGLLNNNVGGFIALGGLIVAAGFTAFYMWRQVVMVFHGDPRTEAADHAHESTATMTIPLIVLAFFSIFIGFINTPDFPILGSIFGTDRFSDWLGQTIQHVEAVPFQWLIAIVALGIAIFAMIVAGRIYGHDKAVVNNRDPLQLKPETGQLWAFANARMYWDQTYYRLFENPYNVTSKFLADTIDQSFWHDWFHNMVLVRGFNAIAHLLSQPVDLGLIDGVVNGVGAVARSISIRLRRVQTGYVRTYAVTILLGVVVVIIVLLLPLLRS
ncbi:MAG TPA: proton-conducting transporter membrane subunit [Phototrophicaceae bacterium]|nr:proton-conducting transporter membrane subunit [Phototrophicaceae bacterium]